MRKENSLMSHKKFQPRTVRMVLPAAMAILVSVASVHGQNERVVWESLRAESISPAAVTAVLEIRRQVQEVLDAGNHLGASFQYYGDVPFDGFYQYEQPGRIVMMLAYAYPYLTKSQQEAVRAYVAAEVANSAYAPWSSTSYLPTTNVTRRSRFVHRDLWSWDRYWGMVGQNFDELNGVMLYGLWLFAYRSGEWNLVNNNWSAIASRYNMLASGGNLYGTYAMHIGQARMGQRRNDNAAVTAAVNNLNSRLAQGQTFSAVDAAALSYFGSWNTERSSWGYHFGGMFLYLSSEIGRWLRDDGSAALRQAIVARQNEGKSKFTHWWLYRLPVFCRWTGDEGVGVPSELIGMMFPIERWVVGAPAESLLAYTIWNAQNAIGDCHVVEATVQTVEACGRERWRDVRNAAFAGPGILVLEPGASVDERLLIDNPRNQTLSVSCLYKPSFLSVSPSGAITGNTPPLSQVDSLIAVLSAEAQPVDTLRTTVVVAESASAPIGRSFERRLSQPTISLSARRLPHRLLLTMRTQDRGPLRISLITLTGELVWERTVHCSPESTTTLTAQVPVSQPLVAIVRHGKRVFRRIMLSP